MWGEDDVTDCMVLYQGHLPEVSSIKTLPGHLLNGVVITQWLGHLTPGSKPIRERHFSLYLCFVDDYYYNYKQQGSLRDEEGQPESHQEGPYSG